MLLKLAREARKRWSALPPAEREALRDDADRVRALAADLTRAVSRRGATPGSDEGKPEDADNGGVSTIATELTSALSALSLAIGSGAVELAKDNSPRSVRVGTRVAKFGLARAKRRLGEAAVGTGWAGSAHAPSAGRSNGGDEVPPFPVDTDTDVRSRR